jgi:hypothetical protein
LFATNYITKYAYQKQFLNEPVSENLAACIVIPSYNEPDIITTLTSLSKVNLPVNKDIEVFVVINAPDNCSSDIIEQNELTVQQVYEFALKNNQKNIQYYALNAGKLAKKFAGAGFARKIGMDEAIRRFNRINKADGIIINLDADSTVEKNYFDAIFTHFEHFPKHVAASIYFEHPLNGAELAASNYRLIYLYELHLRYYRQMLCYIGFPHSFHTMGSAFAVKALPYIKQNGMNRKHAGEDFYFLHKLTALGELGDIVSTCVRPSARPSMRVPFGTGAFITENLNKKENSVFTYQPQSFIELAKLFANIELFYGGESVNKIIDLLELSTTVRLFLSENDFELEIKRINANVGNKKLFIKQFYQWFNGFKMVKYINFATIYYPKMDVLEASKFLFRLNKDNSDDLLAFYRELDRNRN